jgi:DNA mismatch endonuclease (patch repair protein)
MLPAPASEVTSHRMKKTRQRGTPAEIALRRVLFSRGYRYRVDRRVEGVRTRPDILFMGRKLAIFVDGCFWHGCPLHATFPKHNAGWWGEKLKKNSERDAASTRSLEQLGWSVLRFWEHENPSEAADRIQSCLEGSTS